MSDSGDSNEGAENSNPNPQQIAGGGDGVSPSQIGSKSAAPEIEIGGNEAASVDQSVGKIAAASEPLSSISTAGFLAARQRPPFSLPPLPLLPGQVYSSPGQPATAAGSVKSGTAPRAFSSTAIGKTEPPRGLDPKIHHRDAAANLAAVAESLRSSGLVPPKVINQPQPKHSLNTVLSLLKLDLNWSLRVSWRPPLTSFLVCWPRIYLTPYHQSFPILRLAAGTGKPNFGLGPTFWCWRPPTLSKRRCLTGRSTATLVFRPMKSKQ
jgi:hypothetical protein